MKARRLRRRQRPTQYVLLARHDMSAAQAEELRERFASGLASGRHMVVTGDVEIKEIRR